MKNLLCKIKGHSIVKTSKPGAPIKEYQCTQCGEAFTTDGYGRFVRYNGYWEKNHAFFQEYFDRKMVS